MRKLLIWLLAIGYWLLAAPGSVFAQTASLSLDPSSGTFNRGCNFSLNIKLTTGSVQADGVDVILLYDSSRVTATSITNGTLFAEYPGSNIDPLGKVTIMALASVSTPFSGTGTFATVNFTVPETSSTGATRITFDFDSNDKAKTVDSNVVQRGTTVDVLNSVVNGNYTIGSGTCSAQASAAPSASPGGVIVVPVAPGTGQLPGTGGQFIGTPSGQVKTIDQLVDVTGKGPGTFEFTSAIAIVGGVLTVLGILGLALL